MSVAIAALVAIAGCEAALDPTIPRATYWESYNNHPDPAETWDLGEIPVPVFRDWNPQLSKPTALPGGSQLLITGILLERFPETDSQDEWIVFVELFAADGQRVNFLVSRATQDADGLHYQARLVMPKQAGQYECVVRAGIPGRERTPPTNVLARGVLTVTDAVSTSGDRVSA